MRFAAMMILLAAVNTIPAYGQKMDQPQDAEVGDKVIYKWMKNNKPMTLEQEVTAVSGDRVQGVERLPGKEAEFAWTKSPLTLLKSLCIANAEPCTFEPGIEFIRLPLEKGQKWESKFSVKAPDFTAQVEREYNVEGTESVPPDDLQRLLPDECVGSLRELDGLSRFVPSPYVSSYIWFARKLTRERFWARVFSPSNLNYDSYDLSNIRTGWGHRPSVIASNIIYSHRAHGMSDQQIIEATLRELSEFVPDAMSTPIRHAVVNRIPMAIPCPHPGVERLRPRSATALRGLYLAGDWTRTGLPCSMESAVCSGSLAAERIWREIGRPRSIARRIRPPQGIAALVHGLPRWRSAVPRAAQ